MRAEISCGVYALPPMSVDQEVPMWRLTERTVRSALVTAWRLATSPTSTSSDLDQATTEGVVRAPSALAMTVGSPPSMTDTTELVVPRSMPTALAILGPPVGLRRGTARSSRADPQMSGRDRDRGDRFRPRRYAHGA